jgi:hypothetical protein
MFRMRKVSVNKAGRISVGWHGTHAGAPLGAVPTADL